MNRGSRRAMQPLVISRGSSLKPQRVPFTQARFDEGWLQDIIEQNPEVLPIGEIEPVFQPLVSIGREVETGTGYMDHLFISPEGYLTIVETKLWRNPEAMRQVLAQVIDYATELSHWTYEELDNKVKKYQKAGLGIFSYMRTLQDIDETDEHLIIDSINRNLQAGRFLLVIAGDGIRESLENMVDYVQSTPHLQFTLALVEMQVYELPDGDKTLLLVPQIVARTSEIERSVIRITAADNIKIEAVKPEKSVKKQAAKYRITMDEFYNDLPRQFRAVSEKIEKDMTERGCRIDPKQNSYSVKLPDPAGSGLELSLFGVNKQGGLTPGNWWLPDQLKNLSLPADPALEFGRKTADLFGIKLKDKYPGVWEKDIELDKVSAKYPQFLSEVDTLLGKIRQASNKGGQQGD